MCRPGAKILRDFLPCHHISLRSMRRPGIEPGSQPWQGRILPLNHRRDKIKRRRRGFKCFEKQDLRCEMQDMGCD